MIKDGTTEIKRVSAPGRKGKVNRGNFKGERLVGGIDYQIEGGYELPADDEEHVAHQYDHANDFAHSLSQQPADFHRDEFQQNAFVGAGSANYPNDLHFTEQPELFGDSQSELLPSHAEPELQYQQLPVPVQNEYQQYEERDDYVSFLSHAAREPVAPASPLVEEEQEEPEPSSATDKHDDGGSDLADIIAAEKARRATARAEEERLERDAADAKAAAELERRNRRLAEAAALAESTASAESDALLSQQRLVEEQRRKREMFLASMDTFAQSASEFSQQQATSAVGRQSLFGDDDTLTGQFRQLADQHVASTAGSRATSSSLFEPTFDEQPSRPPADYDFNSTGARAGALDQQVAVNIDNDEAPISFAGNRGDANSFAQLTSSLFAANSSAADSFAAATAAAADRESHIDIWGDRVHLQPPQYHQQQQEGGVGNESPLRLPSGVGGAHAKSSQGAGGAGSVAAAVAVDPIAATAVPGVATAPVAVTEVEEEEGTGIAESISNILTVEERRALSPQQAAAWRALQADMTTRRQDFHGAVTYAFDGIFSWQMYGSAEAIEEGGVKYTEYLMRCQWGTNWENLQPWIVARRFREFENLNYQLRRSFPSQAHNIPRLPEKDFFRNLDSLVVDRRRRLLEDYVARIVQSLPTIVRSPYFDEFLGVSDRIRTIKLQLGSEALISAAPQPPSSQQQQPPHSGGYQQSPEGYSQSSSSSLPRPPVVPTPAPVTHPAATAPRPTPAAYAAPEQPYQRRRPQYHQPTYPSSEQYRQDFQPPSHQPQSQPQNYLNPRDIGRGGGGAQHEESVSTEYWDSSDDLGITSPEAAERVREASDRVGGAATIRAMDDMELGKLEEDIRELRFVMHGQDPTKITKPGESRSLLRSCTERWPALRATATFGVHGQGDFTIIPRAMQAEEDLMRIIDDYRSLLLAVSMG